MKKGILLLLGLMSLATVNANNIKKSTSKIGVVNRYNDAVTFVERGIQFHVFFNGDFDFNTNHRNTRYSDYHNRRTNRGVRIERDYKGRVRRVGNVFVNYDARGNVSRIGTVFVKYRFGQLAKVGDLRVKYDRWGHPYYIGNVKNNYYYNDYNDGCDVNIDINLGTIYDYDDVYFYRNNFNRRYRKYKEDNNFYYYRIAPKYKVDKRYRIIKRRKPKNDDVYYKKSKNRYKNERKRR